MLWIRKIKRVNTMIVKTERLDTMHDSKIL